jgi:carbamoyltransferase
MGPEDSSFMRKVLEEFYAITKCPVLVNTSFNVRGEPIVGTPFEALNCFASTGLDFLYLEGLLIAKDSLSKEILSRFTANLNED